MFNVMERLLLESMFAEFHDQELGGFTLERTHANVQRRKNDEAILSEHWRFMFNGKIIANKSTNNGKLFSLYIQGNDLDAAKLFIETYKIDPYSYIFYINDTVDRDYSWIKAYSYSVFYQYFDKNNTDLPICIRSSNYRIKSYFTCVASKQEYEKVKTLIAEETTRFVRTKSAAKTIN